MSHRLKLKQVVPKIYLKGSVELITWSYFRAKREESDKSLEQIAKDLQEAFCWSEDEYSVKTIIQTYCRLNKLYITECNSLNDIL